MINKFSTTLIIAFSFVFVGIFVTFPTEIYACHEGGFIHQDLIKTGGGIWTGDGHVGLCGVTGGSLPAAYDNIIFTNLESGRYEVSTRGEYGGQSDEHIVVVASDGDMDTIYDLDGEDEVEDEPHVWLWGQGTVDMCEQDGSITIRAYSQIPLAAYSLSVDEVRVERVGDGGCPTPVVVECSVNQTTAQTGETVTWTANASGGDGTHTYTWSEDVSGTEEFGDYALDFNGAGDHVDVGNNVSFSGSNITMSVWLYPHTKSGVVSHDGIIRQGNDDFELKFPWTAASSAVQFLIEGSTIVTSNDELDLNTWTHVAVTYDGSVGRIYFDGIENNNRSVSTSITADTSYTAIGCRYTTSSSYCYDGSMDDVRIYGRALSDSEVNDLYMSDVVSDSGLVGHWAFEEGFGTLTNDSSGNGNTGTLVNGPEWTLAATSSSSYSVDTTYLTVGEKTGQVEVVSGAESSTISCDNSVFIGEQCENSSDDDGDGFIDTADAGCYNEYSGYDTNDNNETNTLPQCSNYFDDNLNSFIDFPADLGCSDLFDNDESTIIPPIYQCGNSLDDDGDGFIDAGDAGCYDEYVGYNINDNNETNTLPQCSNYFDDDGDGFIDFPADPGCRDASDVLELNIKFEET